MSRPVDRPTNRASENRCFTCKLAFAAMLLVSSLLLVTSNVDIAKYTDTYELIESRLDAKTGAMIELSVSYNPTSTGFILRAFKKAPAESIVPEEEKQLIATFGGHQESDLKIDFDGTCYFVRGVANSFVRMTLAVSGTKDSLCFYAVHPRASIAPAIKR